MFGFFVQFPKTVRTNPKHGLHFTSSRYLQHHYLTNLISMLVKTEEIARFDQPPIWWEHIAKESSNPQTDYWTIKFGVMSHDVHPSGITHDDQTETSDTRFSSRNSKISTIWITFETAGWELEPSNMQTNMLEYRHSYVVHICILRKTSERQHWELYPVEVPPNSFFSTRKQDTTKHVGWKKKERPSDWWKKQETCRERDSNESTHEVQAKKTWKHEHLLDINCKQLLQSDSNSGWHVFFALHCISNWSNCVYM